MVAAGIPLACFGLWYILAGYSIVTALEQGRQRQERMRPVYEWIAAYVPREATILAYDRRRGTDRIAVSYWLGEA